MELSILCILMHQVYIRGGVDDLELLDDMRMVEVMEYLDLQFDLIKYPHSF
jgi:hypothetical protein